MPWYEIAEGFWVTDAWKSIAWLNRYIEPGTWVLHGCADPASRGGAQWLRERLQALRVVAGIAGAQRVCVPLLAPTDYSSPRLSRLLMRTGCFDKQDAFGPIMEFIEGDCLYE